jgi:mono/diheme cytochrome c family protein
LAALTLGLLGACTGELELDRPSDLSGAPRADAGVVNTVDGPSYFTANILPMLSLPRPKGACAVCHQGTSPANGPDFLGPNAGTNYTSLLASPTVVGMTPATSTLYTRGSHAGDAFLPDELVKIAIWIEAER